ncbi:MAG: hypothetical protein COU90_02340 [Candidatus Ryanbacteria bacterium CG10_big_fil_rev_8_21_14_0_10_43_42]|uniref:Peptidase S1 domain-containing protein n=1 Tax=Candidatus Ryanbacteria bacterium CG10_big_fil_rev_8_21_14_0_10_43_42 TaxID=1974864 RepID=A0A2M8KXJ7_9BACT|nr:MAG: hypothetical protein COU90_02340 [Candidatus Ryanbacteria bacterium CG10_big_fil_rev_8_21_14_0_10_43_42]
MIRTLVLGLCFVFNLTSIACADQSFAYLPKGSEQQWRRIVKSLPNKFKACRPYEYDTYDNTLSQKTVVRNIHCQTGISIILRGKYILVPWHVLRVKKESIERYLRRWKVSFTNVRFGSSKEVWTLVLGSGKSIKHGAFTLLFEDVLTDSALLHITDPLPGSDILSVPITRVSPGDSETFYLPGMAAGCELRTHVRTGKRNYIEVDNYIVRGMYFGANISVEQGDSGVPLFVYRNKKFYLVGMALGKKWHISWYGDVYNIGRKIKGQIGTSILR